jgi:hypothetical protein
MPVPPFKCRQLCINFINIQNGVMDCTLSRVYYQCLDDYFPLRQSEQSGRQGKKQIALG